MSRRLSLRVPDGCTGMSLRDFARKRLGFSARVLAELKRTENGILVGGEPCHVSRVLQAGDRLTFTLPEERPGGPAVPLPLPILFENEDYLAVDKPSGMPVHPSPGHSRDSLLNAAAFYYEETGQACAFRPLYRLDRDTSGIVLLGKHRAAVSCAQVEKRYYAVCQGELSGSGVIDIPIGLAPGSRILRECGHGDRAVTHWKALSISGGFTLLSLRLETGRTHQIRVHLSGAGFPLAGDDLYGGCRERIGRQALHCGLVRLHSPVFSLETELCADFPADLQEAFPWLPSLKTIQEEELECLLV